MEAVDPLGVARRRDPALRRTATACREGERAGAEPQLRERAADGVPHREVWGQVPPRVEYSLSELGKALNTALLPLGEWGDRHMMEIASRKHPNRSKGSPIVAWTGWGDRQSSPYGHRFSTSLCRLADSAPRGRVSSERGNSRQQSCAGWYRAAEGAARYLPPEPVRTGGNGRVRSAPSPLGRTSEAGGPPWSVVVRTPWFSLNSPRAPWISPRSGHDLPLNERFHGHPGVAGRLRRVVVARRCAQHHLRRVMVETPPRAGPSPPHGPARFLCAAARPACAPE